MRLDALPDVLPSVAERMPEIRRSAFLWNPLRGRSRPYASTTIPLLASVGCPYRCDFCVDWSDIRTDSTAGGSEANGERYAGDAAANIPTTHTAYWVR